ncbi:hypothetical protein EDD18DRAFT_1350727 [Armillaria luteobubalina]|uniref:Uncharacterized protein n=1 Tax=Armillaria luteobubalina TaxID=153913 RepID=A0AA39TR06_9AGAR|nr:hypothetical protein EDD18DRAFT_1350727 [Armillaria luteobubalina]
MDDDDDVQNLQHIYLRTRKWNWYIRRFFLVVPFDAFLPVKCIQTRLSIEIGSVPFPGLWSSAKRRNPLTRPPPPGASTLWCSRRTAGPPEQLRSYSGSPGLSYYLMLQLLMPGTSPTLYAFHQRGFTFLFPVEDIRK